jgi:hypothetical protein
MVQDNISIKKAPVDPSKINNNVDLPHELRQSDFHGAMEDICDLFYDCLGVYREDLDGPFRLVARLPSKRVFSQALRNAPRGSSRSINRVKSVKRS